MDTREYPDGTFDFRALVSGNYYFVDKTMLIADVCEAKNRTFLYTRPRRFGKSMNLSMLDYFFNLRYGNDEDIFRGLKIESCERCTPFRNAYPVIRMNFGCLDGSSPSSFADSLRSMISIVAEDAVSLLESTGHTDSITDRIRDAISLRLDITETRMFVSDLCRLYRRVFDRDTVILVDEYDRCLQGIRSPNRFAEVFDELVQFMEQTFRFNGNIRFGVVTGIMPLAKTGMLSSFDNADICSILDERGDGFFGFTESEVIQLLDETGNPLGKMDEIRRWYDGYRFGGADIYNPYSVVLYLQNRCRPEAYWNNMTGGGMSPELVAGMSAESLSTLKGLRENRGSSFESPIDVRISYTDVMSPAVDPSVVYSYLAMSGYLNAIRTGRERDGKPLCTITMVNNEVSYAFDSLVSRADSLADYTRSAMDAVYSRDRIQLKENLELLLSGLQLDDGWFDGMNDTEMHNKYRDIIYAYLMDPSMDGKEEMPFGLGRADISFHASNGRPPVILEVKSTRSESTDRRLLAREGLAQIDEKGYTKQQDMRDAICVGVGIWHKFVEVSFGE
ncbi:MAG: AAA family ATPase [Candidatus Methanomethylophilaceae archaeon]|nr:AAA family ATPase [Candidatus Methanomethylophilaceae archaeon]